MELDEVIRRLQKAPYNKSLSDIRMMTIPMIHNLFAPDPDENEASAEDLAKLLGGNNRGNQPPSFGNPDLKSFDFMRR